MIKTHRILILEDSLEVLSILLKKFSLLEHEQELKHEFSVMILSESAQVEEYINQKEEHEFDVILLDRDCKLCGSFHALDFTKFDPAKIIAISSNPEYNAEVEKFGVTKSVLKDFNELDSFAENVLVLLKEITLGNGNEKTIPRH